MANLRELLGAWQRRLMDCEEQDEEALLYNALKTRDELETLTGHIGGFEPLGKEQIWGDAVSEEGCRR